MEDRTVIQNPVVGSLRPGTRLNSVYEIERLIANGGMGEVYRGFNIVTRDPVAIKLIRPEFASDPEIFELFRREASALHNLPHEAIVRYFVFSIDPDLRRAYLAMEFVDGPSLTDRFAAGPMALDDVTILQQRMAPALDVAHRHGIVHRDISPDNIILPNRDVRLAKIIDFGIARSLERKDVSIIGGRFAGKYNFASPEQFGLYGGEVTPKSDIYSFGLVLAAAMRGRPIDMSGSEADAIAKRSVVPDLSDVDPTFRPLLQWMLQPLPVNRPGSMAEIAAWAPAGDKPRAASHALRPPSTLKPSGNRNALLFGAVAALAVMASMAYVLRSDIAQVTQSFVAPAPPTSPSKLPPIAAADLSAPAMPTQPDAAPSRSNAGPPPRDEGPNPTKLARAEEASPKLSNPPPQAPNADDVVDALPPSTPQPDIDLPSAVVGAQYIQVLPAFLDRGGKGLRLAASGLPDGLNFLDKGQGTGVIEGDPWRPGHAAIQIVATDHNNRTAQMTVRLAIADRTSPTPPDVAIASKEASTPKAVARPNDVPPAGDEKTAPPPGSGERGKTAGLEPLGPAQSVSILKTPVGAGFTSNLPPLEGGSRAADLRLRAEPDPPAVVVVADPGAGSSRILGAPTIAALENSGVARTEQAPESGKEPEKKDWRAEIGTAETEKALNLTPAEEKEIQLRLIALDLYKGPVTSSLDPPTRRAIAEWQKSEGAALSSYLGPMQLAELRQESEDAYQNLVAAQSAPQPKAGESAKSAPRAARPRAPAVRAPEVHERAAREPTKTPRRHWAGRPPSPRSAVTESAAAPHCNGSPAWCEKAGLPVDSGAPPVGRPYGW